MRFGSVDAIFYVTCLPVLHHVTEDHNFEFKVTVLQHSFLEFEEVSFHGPVNMQ